MLARHAFKAEFVPGSRRGSKIPGENIRLLSYTSKPSQNSQQTTSPTFKKNWNRQGKPTRNSSPPIQNVQSLKTPIYSNESVPPPWPGSPNFILHKLHSFQAGITRRDALVVLRLWHSIEKDNLLHLLGPSDLENCSRLVISLCPVEQSSNWSGPSREAAEELALGLSTRISTSALRACFAALVVTNDPRGVLRLYNRFLTHVEHQGAFGDQGSVSGEDVCDELLTMPNVRNSGTLVDKELSIFAIMAHALQDDFQSAIQTGVHANWSVPSIYVADTLLDAFAPSPQFRQKVLTFVRHADAARLLSRPSIFHKHLSNLVSTPATRSLQGLYATMVEGLSEDYPWAIVDSGPSDRRPVVIYERTWAAFISAFLDVQRIDLAESAWDDMVRYGHKPGPGVWTVLIRGIGKLKGSRHALALWRSMKEASVAPDSSSYQAIIQVMANARQWKEATELFDESQSASLLHSDPNNELLHSTMIGAHLDDSHESDAIRLLEEMAANGPHPTTHTFNKFLTYYHSKEDMKSLSSMLKRMTAYGVSGDVATFSILLSTLLRILDRGKAIQQTLAIMNQHKIKPNVATYTTIMTSLLQEKDKKALEAAFDLLRTMEESGDPSIEPNVVTYTAVLNGVHGWIGSDDQLVQDCTELVLWKMKARHIKFNKVTYNVLLKTCLENPSPAGLQKALQFYRQMRREKIALTGDTWHIMLHGLAKRREWVVAYEILRNMESSGITMTDWLKNAAEEVALGYVTSRPRLASASGR
jgi:pentatricopeptide repeat protein